MMADFFLSMHRLSWADFKTWVSAKTLKVQYAENVDQYWIFAVEGSLSYWTEIWKSGATLPTGVDAGTNASNRTDFETNYAPTANAAVLAKTVLHDIQGNVLVGQKAMAASVPVTMASDQPAIKVGGTNVEGSPLTVNPAPVSGVDSSGNVHSLKVDANGNLQVVVTAAAQALPLIINLNYEESIGAIVASQYKRVQEYTVPAGYNGWLIRYSSYQNESSKSRFVAVKEMGTLDFITNAFVAGEVYVGPQWSSVIEAYVTTQTSASGGANTTVTVTYTNRDGTTGRTGTFTVPKSSIVGTRIKFVPQAGDLGVQSIQNMTDDSTNVGAIKVIGNIQLAYHNDLSSTIQLETNYQPGAIAFPTGTVLAIEFAGGTVSKDRLFDLLIQLVPTT